MKMNNCDICAFKIYVIIYFSCFISVRATFGSNYIGVISFSAQSFLGAGCTPFLDITCLKSGSLVHPKWYIFLFNLKFSQ